jgi:RecA/RadA recombinase
VPKQALSKQERESILNKKLKSLDIIDLIVEGEGFETKHKDYISTGVDEINATLGEIPGFAQGNLIELLGDSGSGKTYLALKTASEAQKKGLKVAFFNVENSFYEPRANQIGVVTRDKNLFQMIPNLGSGETICDAILAMVESELYGLIVVDSVTALIPNDDLEKSFNDPSKIGAHAKLINSLSKKLLHLTEKHNTSVILINQYRIGAGSIPGQFVKTASGGHGLRYYEHYRLEFRKIGGANGQILNGEKEIIGGKTEIKFIKNRFGKSGDDIKCIMPVYYTDEDSDIFAEFINRGKAKGCELIKEVGLKGKKKYQFSTEDGEVFESSNPVEFISLLKSTPAPSQRKRGDNSTNYFEYVCRAMKFTEASVQALDKKLSQNSFTHDLQDSAQENHVEYPEDNDEE